MSVFAKVWENKKKWLPGLIFVLITVALLGIFSSGGIHSLFTYTR